MLASTGFYDFAVAHPILAGVLALVLFRALLHEVHFGLNLFAQFVEDVNVEVTGLTTAAERSAKALRDLRRKVGLLRTTVLGVRKSTDDSPAAALVPPSAPER